MIPSKYKTKLRVNDPLCLSPSTTSVFREIGIKSVLQEGNVISKQTAYDLCLFENGFPSNGRETWLRK